MRRTLILGLRDVGKAIFVERLFKTLIFWLKFFMRLHQYNDNSKEDKAQRINSPIYHIGPHAYRNLSKVILRSSRGFVVPKRVE